MPEGTFRRNNSLSDSLASVEEAELIQELRRELAADLADAPSFPELVGDTRMLRTLRGFDHKVHAAADAFREHLEARRAWGLNAIREQLVASVGGHLWNLRCADLPYGEELLPYIPEVVVFARGEDGDPVSLGIWGKQRVSDLIKEVEDWRNKFMQYSLSLMEAKALLLDQASEDQGRLVHFVNVLDLENWSAIGNADRTWPEFVTQMSGPVLQTYHDFNSYIFAIRTTRWARMAYSMIEPALPKKVKEKILLLGDNFQSSQELRRVLDEGKLNQLKNRQFASAGQRQQGRVIVKGRDSFEFQIEVPSGATLTWTFSVEGSQCMQRCSWCSPSELNFCVLACTATPGGAMGYEPLLCGWKNTLVSGTSSGKLDPCDDDDKSRMLVLRWDNRNAWLTSKLLQYRIELELPLPRDSSEEWGKSARLYVVMVAANLAALGVAFALDLFTKGVHSPL
eukprot:TRINITY_DN11730_c3_g1_i1.p1 TRINITY_DN11730_c3_g1~~TRINITY_DN11730_c3_g1_i1.p1  ORF type:complete len:453 (+),score=80.59 TRINITY_DN11730_c3_g1_i1:115-1473(+)